MAKIGFQIHVLCFLATMVIQGMRPASPIQVPVSLMALSLIWMVYQNLFHWRNDSLFDCCFWLLFFWKSVGPAFDLRSLWVNSVGFSPLSEISDGWWILLLSDEFRNPKPPWAFSFFNALLIIPKFSLFSISCFHWKCYRRFSAVMELQNREILICNRLWNLRLDAARKIFNQIPSPPYTMMISGYTRNSILVDDLNLFGELPVRDVISWNSMISECVKCEKMNMALKLFDELPERSVGPWAAMMNGCFRLGKVDQTERFFYQMPVKNTAAWNAQVHRYLQFGKVDNALMLSKQMPSKTVILWTIMICGLDERERSGEAFDLFKKMLVCCIQSTSRTFTCVITACVNTPANEWRGLVTTNYNHLLKFSQGLILSELHPSVYCLYWIQSLWQQLWGRRQQIFQHEHI